MYAYAYSNGQMGELFNEMPPEDQYHASFLADIHELPDDAGEDWLWDEEKQGWFPPPEPTPEELQEQYEQRVIALIHERYSADDEASLTNKALEAMLANKEPPDEYFDYRDYVQECKEKAKKEVYGE